MDSMVQMVRFILSDLRLNIIVLGFVFQDELTTYSSSENGVMDTPNRRFLSFIFACLCVMKLLPTSWERQLFCCVTLKSNIVSNNSRVLAFIIWIVTVPSIRQTKLHRKDPSFTSQKNVWEENELPTRVLRNYVLLGE